MNNAVVIGCISMLGAVPEISSENAISRIGDQDTWPAFGPLDVS